MFTVVHMRVWGVPPCRPHGTRTLRDATGGRHAQAYIAALRAHPAAPEVIALDPWHGFALALRVGLRAVRTEVVLVCPHDFEFQRPVDAQPIVALLQRREGVRYVGFTAANNHGARYLDRVRHKTGLDLPISVRGGVPLAPLLSWKENPHLALVGEYLSTVLARAYRPGDFIEDTFGQQMRREIRAHGLPAHAQYGTFLLWLDSSTSSAGSEADNSAAAQSALPVTHHLDGRAYLTLSARTELGHRIAEFDRQRTAAATSHWHRSAGGDDGAGK